MIAPVPKCYHLMPRQIAAMQHLIPTNRDEKEDQQRRAEAQAKLAKLYQQIIRGPDFGR